MGRYWFTVDAPATFSSEHTRPVIMVIGHGFPCSIAESNFRISPVRSSGSLNKSSLDHASGPVAALVFFFLSVSRQRSIVISGNFCSGQDGKYLLKHSRMVPMILGEVLVSVPSFTPLFSKSCKHFLKFSYKFFLTKCDPWYDLICDFG